MFFVSWANPNLSASRGNPFQIHFGDNAGISTVLPGFTVISARSLWIKLYILGQWRLALMLRRFSRISRREDQLWSSSFLQLVTNVLMSFRGLPSCTCWLACCSQSCARRRITSNPDMTLPKESTCISNCRILSTTCPSPTRTEWPGNARNSWAMRMRRSLSGVSALMLSDGNGSWWKSRIVSEWREGSHTFLLVLHLRARARMWDPKNEVSSIGLAIQLVSSPNRLAASYEATNTLVRSLSSVLALFANKSWCNATASDNSWSESWGTSQLSCFVSSTGSRSWSSSSSSKRVRIRWNSDPWSGKYSRSSLSSRSASLSCLKASSLSSFSSKFVAEELAIIVRLDTADLNSL